MALKALLAAIAAAAVGVGFILPAPPHRSSEPQSQIAQIELRP
jgi:hypothetical protein